MKQLMSIGRVCPPGENEWRWYLWPTSLTWMEASADGFLHGPFETRDEAIAAWRLIQ